MKARIQVLVFAFVAFAGSGCCRSARPCVTAFPASPANMCEPAGIPFYLPKPLLVISKNFYHVEEPKVGLAGPAPIPDSFDKQETYANLSLQGSFSRTSSSTGGSGTTAGRTAADVPGAPGTTAADATSADAVTVPKAADLPNDGLA